MKTKKFNNKLVLNKSTIADLDGNQMNKVQGGVDPWTANCTTKPGHICPKTCNDPTVLNTCYISCPYTCPPCNDTGTE